MKNGKTLFWLAIVLLLFTSPFFRRFILGSFMFMLIFLAFIVMLILFGVKNKNWTIFRYPNNTKTERNTQNQNTERSRPFDPHEDIPDIEIVDSPGEKETPRRKAAEPEDIEELPR
ncbi:MAG: hypothetical protein LBQ97_03530 [Fusobacteriaceae bacterium]|jgi:cell division protein FtsN|nr:hypothetical protein [Fusobacteriaceae bacterium]